MSAEVFFFAQLVVNDNFAKGPPDKAISADSAQAEAVKRERERTSLKYR